MRQQENITDAGAGVILFATFAEKMSRMEKREQKNFFIKMVEDKKAIIRDIRDGVSTKVIEEERDVRFVTPL